jgi:beta-N-acetylhexosaminidase
MTQSQRVGQLFMGAVPATGSARRARHRLARYDVGNVILVGQYVGGTGEISTRIARARRAGVQSQVQPFVAVDQEGGQVQHLAGAGFSTIPTALRQGALSTTRLRSDWSTWAGQLRRVGVTLDLAPVGDVVPASVGTENQPIGRYQREYGHQPAGVARHVKAVVHGIRDAGVDSTVKHFPGLGRATGNTDVTVGVNDPTTPHDRYLKPYRAAIHAGVPFVMVSTAIYPNIDPGVVGTFSHLITTTMLRHQLGFTGVIISDSLSAVSVSRYSYAERAVLALDAGVDVLLVSVSKGIAAMRSAVIARMGTDAAFASVVKTAVMRVLVAKAKAGLIAS